MSTVSDFRGSRAGPVRVRRRPDKTMVPMPREDLSRGIIQTEVSPGLARVMTAVFLAVIIVLPVVQAGIEWELRRHIQALDVLKRVPTRENLGSYEKELSRHSVARRAVQPRLQLALSRFLGFGNTNVIIGQEGWLFYRPGVEFVTGPGLLDATRLRLRKRELIEAGEKRPCPDPRPAIRDFNEQCRKADAHLVVVPVPDKSMLHPAELTSRLSLQGTTAVLTNADCAQFLKDLRADGVDVFDPTPEYLIAGEPPRFLRQDTHWTPQWMETVAHDLSEHVKTIAPLGRESSRSFFVQEKQVSRVGDIVDMLQLPPDQRLFPPQSVTLQRVVDSRTGAAWGPNDAADVLLLGDSFSNIYCAADMGWGDAAGFPAQLARFLERDVDVIASTAPEQHQRAVSWPGGRPASGASVWWSGSLPCAISSSPTGNRWRYRHARRPRVHTPWPDQPVLPRCVSRAGWSRPHTCRSPCRCRTRTVSRTSRFTSTGWSKESIAMTYSSPSSGG